MLWGVLPYEEQGYISRAMPLPGLQSSEHHWNLLQSFEHHWNLEVSASSGPAIKGPATSGPAALCCACAEVRSVTSVRPPSRSGSFQSGCPLHRPALRHLGRLRAPDARERPASSCRPEQCAWVSVPRFAPACRSVRRHKVDKMTCEEGYILLNNVDKNLHSMATPPLNAPLLPLPRFQAPTRTAKKKICFLCYCINKG